MKTTLLISITLWASSCGTAATHPSGLFSGTWHANHESQSIRRDQEKREVKCSDPAFNGYICLTPESLWAVKNSCKPGELE